MEQLYYSPEFGMYYYEIIQPQVIPEQIIIKRCKTCRQTGHWSMECPNKKKEENEINIENIGNGKNIENNVKIEKEECEDLEEVNYCGNCGKKRKPKNKFCTKCGTKL